MEETVQDSSGEMTPKWRPLSARDRRVVGVLVEKAKTTPTAYPMTLNAIRNASNQKSNRYPVMDLQEEDVAESLESLRCLGAVVEIHGDARVAKYRHLMYDWLRVDKVQIAVMTELLLRGAQTIGELRGRSARMEPIADLAALRPVLAALHEKRLIVYLTPEGRGCVVTHSLYQPSELERLKSEYRGDHSRPIDAPVMRGTSGAATAVPNPSVSATPTAEPIQTRPETDALRRDVEQLKSDLRDLREELARITEPLRNELDDVKRQLGI